MNHPEKRFYQPRPAACLASARAAGPSPPPPGGRQREFRLVVRLPPASKLGEATVHALEIIALGIVHPVPDAFLARPENQEFRRELMELAFDPPSSSPEVFRAVVRDRCLERFPGKGKENRAKKIAKRVEALFRLIEINGPGYVRDLIAENELC